MEIRILQKTKNGSHHITIPEIYRKELGWEKRDIIAFILKDNALHLRHIPINPEVGIDETTL